MSGQHLPSTAAAHSFSTVFTAALQGSGCHVEYLDDDLRPLPMTAWRRTADSSDRVLLDQCVGDTLDLGCGPGRMGEYLAAHGHRVLADGNIGIGGDPQALLDRVRELVGPDGRAVVDLRPPGGGLRVRWARIRTDDHSSKPSRWAVVAVDSVVPLARAAGFPVTGVHEHDGRWFAVLEGP